MNEINKPNFNDSLFTNSDSPARAGLSEFISGEYQFYV